MIGFASSGRNFPFRRKPHKTGTSVIAMKAAAIIEDGRVDAFRAERYAGWKGELGQAIHKGDATLASIADLAAERDLQPQPRSGRQEWLENMMNRF